MQNNNLREHARSRKPLIDTGRMPIVLKKYPDDLDFTQTVGGTTYVVKSRFDPNASESLFTKVSRLFSEGKDLSE